MMEFDGIDYIVFNYLLLSENTNSLLLLLIKM